MTITVAWTSKRLHDLSVLKNQIDEVKRLLMQTITTSWMSNGVEQSVTTNFKDSETADEWLARHDEAVVAAQRKYPKDE